MEQPNFKGKGEHSVNELEVICNQFKQYASYLNSEVIPPLKQRNKELDKCLRDVLFILSCNHASNGISLELRYKTEYDTAKAAIEANSIK